jgi:hypothetical protein
MEPVSYFMSGMFWFSTSMALLLTFLVGWKFTGMTEGGKMSQNINFASSGNKLILAFAFLVSEVLLNLMFVFSGSFV